MSVFTKKGCHCPCACSKITKPVFCGTGTSISWYVLANKKQEKSGSGKVCRIRFTRKRGNVFRISKK